MNQPTHIIAVNAYIIESDTFLLLKRNIEPRIWAPPGGHLNVHENPIEGLKREVYEETGLEIEVITAVNTWFGLWKDQPLLAIDYLAKVNRGELKLSAEHSRAVWISLPELARGTPVTLKPEIGFKLADFEYALKVKNSLFRNRF